MMWQTPEERLALLELLTTGKLKCRRAQAVAFAALAELPWTRVTGRRDEIGLVDARRHELVALLLRVWPTWSEALADLTIRGLQPTPDGWRQLEDARRAELLPQLPGKLNRRTAAALAAPHSKASLTEERMLALGGTEPTSDGSLRLRPPRGLVAHTRTGAVDLAAVAAVLGEVSIPERAFKDGLSLSGSIRAVLLVENLGAWRDLPEIDGWLFAHVPGWDTTTVILLLNCLRQVPAIHFGDLDPNGIRIHLHLRERFPGLRWFVPEFWEELVATRGQPGSWPDDLGMDDLPTLVRTLAQRGLWLEQEPLVVDPRIRSTLEAML